MEMKRLYRSRDNVMIGGVCSGLADNLNVDPTIMRVIFAILFFAGFGGLIIYIVLWIIVPLEPRANESVVDVNVGPPKELSNKKEESKKTKPTVK
ncbi:MAG TPA: PspC domain-containing protein [Anaerolineae bacterium]|nr:PspC domain-containing protein [Anaerolineae bacterium]